MMRRQLIAGIAAAAVLSLALGGCATASSPAGSDDQIEVTVAVQFAKGGWDGNPFDEFAQQVTEASDGRITFDLHYSDSLVKAAEVPGAMQDGVVDMALIYASYNPSLFPINNWAAKLGFVGDRSRLEGYLAQAGAVNEWAMNEDILMDEFTQQGIHVLANTQVIPVFDLLCKEEVRTLDDAAGLRVRVAGEPWADEARELGMEPVQLLGSEMYEGLQRGVVDCVMIHPAAYVDSGLWELAPYHVAADHTGWSQYYLSLSQTFWDGLPDWAQAAFEESVPFWMQSVATNYSDKIRTFFEEGPEKYDIQSTQPAADYAEALSDYHEGLLDGGLAASAPEGLDEEAIASLIDRRLEAQEKWESLTFDAELGLGDYTTWAEWVESVPETPDLTPWRKLLESNR